MSKILSVHTSVSNGASERLPAWEVPLIVFLYLVVFWIVLPAFLFVAGLRLDVLVPVSIPFGTVTDVLGWGLIIAGSTVTSLAMAQLRFQGHGYPISHLPPNAFVSRGLYRWRRHPIYIGYTALFIGIALLIDSPWSVCFSGPLLIFLWLWYTLFFEEPVLINRFGESYAEYRQRTPILLPGWCEAASWRVAESLMTFIMPAIDRLANRTVLYRIGDLIIVTYGAFVAAGTFVALVPLGGFLERGGVDAANIGMILAGIPVCGVFVARMFWWLAHRKDPAQSFMVSVRKVGFVSWGGLGGMLVFLGAAATYAHLDLLQMTDDLMRVLFVAYAIGRLGCLTYGCCYGVTTSGPGVRYTNTEAKVIREHGNLEQRRHPTQVYSIFAGVLLAIFLNTFDTLRPSAGTITALGLIGYGVTRFYIEPFRDRRRVVGGVLTEGHLGCIAGIVAGWVMLVMIPTGTGGLPIDFLEAWAAGINSLPYALAATVFVFVVMGSHWKRIGTW